MITVVIHDSKAAKRTTGLPFGALGDREFFYPVVQSNAVSRKKGEEPIQLKPVVLKNGANFLDANDWEKVMAVEVNAADVNALCKDRVLTIYQPEGTASDITAFADEDAITHIIESTNDRDRLDLWLRVEKRAGDNGELDVRRLIAERIRELDELAKDKLNAGLF